MVRDVETLADEKFDLLVIGGGILGVCVARDAVMRGLRTALIEKKDFGAGTSWNCLKIVHGGLRYLQHFDLSRVRRAVRERSFWLRAAPHLVDPLPVLVPSRRSGLERKSLLRAALFVNTLFSLDRNRGLDPDRSLPGGRGLSRQELLTEVSRLASEDFTGGVVFYDALMYSPERLILSVVKSAVQDGVVAANHVSFEEGIVRGDQLVGVRVRDRLTGDEFEVNSRSVINATGPSASNCAERLLGHPPPEVSDVEYSLAINIGVEDLGLRKALALKARPNNERGGESRRLLAVPWRDLTLLGTGHYDVDADSLDEIEDPSRFVHRFVDDIASALPYPAGRLERPRLVHWGLLPDHGPPGEVDLVKKPLLIDHSEHGRPGAVTAITVKFTTARQVAEEAVDRICSHLRIDPVPSPAGERPLVDAPEVMLSTELSRAYREYGDLLDADVLDYLVRTFGTAYHDVIARCREDDDGLVRLQAEEPVLRGQLRYSMESEMAETMEDLLQRRTELGPRGLISDELVNRAKEVVRNGSEEVSVTPGT